ncbi:MAG: flagellar protein F [Thermoplasmata archaeon]
MGFSYTVAAVIMLSSSLIFFGMVYSSYVQSNESITNANQKLMNEVYDYDHSRLVITGYFENLSAGKVTVNFTNNGSIMLNLAESNVILNGSIIKFNYYPVYLFPLQNGSVSFSAGPGIYDFELVMQNGYEVYEKLVV